MVSKLLSLLNREVKTINQGALLLALFSIASQLLGLIRDRSLAHIFGPSAVLDVYYAAFRIPDFLYNSFAAFVSVTALLPLLSTYLKSKETDNKHDIRDFSHSLFTVFTISMVAVCALTALFMKPLSFLVVPGFSPDQRELFVLLSRILLFSPFFLGLSNLLGSFSQVQKKFYAFALAPVFYNICILIGIFFLRPSMGITGIILGVVMGAFVHMAIQIPTMLHLKAFPRLTFRPNVAFIKKVISVSLPRAFSLSLNNLTLLMMGSIASLLAVGSISVFNFSYTIQTTPLYIIGISYAVAAFPALSRFFQEEQYAVFSEVIHRAIKNIFFFSIPLSLLFIVLRAQIVRVLLGSGMFTWEDTRLVAASLALFAISIAAQSVVLLLVRIFYAMGNTKLPLKINLLTVLITALSAAALMWVYSQSLSFRYFITALLRLDGIENPGIILLPLAYSVGQIINASLLWFYFRKALAQKYHTSVSFTRILFHICAAGILGASVAYGTLQILSYATRSDTVWGILTQGILAGAAGSITYLLFIAALNHDELKSMTSVLVSKFWKQKPLAPEQPEV